MITRSYSRQAKEDFTRALVVVSHFKDLGSENSRLSKSPKSLTQDSQYIFTINESCSPTFSSSVTSLNESGFVDPSTVVENRGTMSYATVVVPIVIVLEIVVLVLVFVIKPIKQLKALGIFLIVVSVVVLIGTS
jgi:hypothetical protein